MFPVLVLSVRLLLPSPQEFASRTDDNTEPSTQQNSDANIPFDCTDHCPNRRTENGHNAEFASGGHAAF